jgi:hypothetical protein
MAFWSTLNFAARLFTRPGGPAAARPHDPQATGADFDEAAHGAAQHTSADAEPRRTRPRQK